MPRFADYVQPAHYNRSDGARVCVHNIPIGRGACAECHSLTDEHWATGCACMAPTVPDQTPDQILRTAAQALRDAANGARHEMKTGSYWHGLDPAIAWERGITNAVGGHAGGLAALMSPDAALALADWLDTAADYYAPGVHHPTHVVRALAVARAILGEVTQ